jgi:hypothetical protein
MLTPRSTSPVPELSPAVKFLLMTGDSATVRIGGWVNLAQVPAAEFDAYILAAWTAHGAALVEEARPYDFVPAGISERRPRGAGVRRWRHQFLAQHRY